MTLAYYNGTYRPLSEITISPLDRGFLFGDSIYDVMPVYQGHLFRFAAHYARLRHSIAATQMNVDYSEAQWRALLQPLIDAQTEPSFNIYVQITRGQEAQRLHKYSSTIVPNILAFTTPHPDYRIDDFTGIRAVTQQDIRWRRCDIKATSLLGSILMQQEATRQGAQETIVIDNGFVYEATASNVFIVKHNTLITPPLSTHLLGGITRDLILELAVRHHLPYRESTISTAELFNADEIWVTGSGKEIQPVIQIDDQLVNGGTVGPVWQRMVQWFFDYKREVTSHG